jgi:hypothetical protein
MLGRSVAGRASKWKLVVEAWGPATGSGEIALRQVDARVIPRVAVPAFATLKR